MKTNNLYRRELEAARRLSKWADGHSSLLNILTATAAVIAAGYIFLKYPI